MSTTLTKEEAAIRIQAYWKGYICRKRLKSKQKNRQKRDHAAKEILSTEQHYCKVLDTIVMSYLTPVRNQSLLTKKNLNLIFSNIEDIRMINLELLEALENRMANWDDTVCVGDVFGKLVPWLKLYTVYCANYNSGLTKLEEKRESSTKFAAFLDKTREEIGNNMPVQSYLIQPVQRIPRYRMLFAELLKLTSEDHPDYKPIENALRSVETIANTVNESIREAEYLNELVALKKKIVGTSDLVKEKRYLIREGPLMKVCRKDTKRRMFFLFNDLLLYAVRIEAPTAGGEYRFHRSMPIRYTRIADAADRDDMKNAFQILSKEKSFTVFAKDPEEKQSWMESIQQAITKAQHVGPSIGGAGSSSGVVNDNAAKHRGATGGVDANGEKIDEHAPAPVWVPDKDRKNCMICDMRFTTLKRRHHCRSCGVLACGSCSSYKAHLPNIGKTCRVCLKCYETVTGNSIAQSKKTKSKNSSSSSVNLLGSFGSFKSSSKSSLPQTSSPLHSSSLPRDVNKTGTHKALANRRPPPSNQTLPPSPSNTQPISPDSEDDYTSGSDFYDSDDDEWLPPTRAPPTVPI